MAQTEHLGLHQWEAGDNFLRTDFNEDFAKIDAAAGGLTQQIAAVEESFPLVKIKEVVTGQEAARVDVDLTDIDWIAWRQVDILIRGEGNGNYYGDILFNGREEDGDYKYRDSNGNNADSAHFGTFYISRDGTDYATRVTLYGGATLVCGEYVLCGGTTSGYRVYMASASGVNMGNLATLNLKMSKGTLKAGAKIAFWGWKW